MRTIIKEINTLLRKVIFDLYGKTGIDILQFYVHNSSRNDYQFNQVQPLAKQVDLPIETVSKDLSEALTKNTIIESTSIVKVGEQCFIAINLYIEYIQNFVNKIYSLTILNKKLPLPSLLDFPKKVLVDYSSPNIAKEMHVGHLRSTIIGESLCRIFEYGDSEVKRVNHIGDWGTQFGMLIAYIKKEGIKDYDITELMKYYKESKKLFDNDPEFKKTAHKETVDLQHGAEENITIWKKICDISMNAFNKIYVELDIPYGTKYCSPNVEVKGESFYQSRMVKFVEDHENILTKKDGMKLLFVDGHEVPMVVVKSDGGFTYDTSDLAAAKYRLLEEKMDKIIYVIDSGQQVHLKLLFQAAKDLGWNDKNQMVHVGFGLVLGSDGTKLKTRSGETIKLQGLLDEAYRHAHTTTKELAKEKHQDWTEEKIISVSKKIAINCVKYSDLCNPRLSNYKFSYEKMLNLKGNTAVYLMYGLARCQAILRKISDPQKLENILCTSKTLDPNNNSYEQLTMNELLTMNVSLCIDTPEARTVVFKLAKYLDAYEETVKELSPHYLCNYLYDLISTVHKYYDNNNCILFDKKTGEIIKIYEHRVRLINLVIIVMMEFFKLIGLEHIDEI